MDYPLFLTKEDAGKVKKNGGENFSFISKPQY